MATKRPPSPRIGGALAFFHHEAAGGIVLLAAAVLALILQNSPASHLYDALLETPLMMTVDGIEIGKPLLHWINDGLMAIFFFLVGLEIKREMLVGELSTRQQAALPVIAAAGGMAVPALIYVAINRDNAIALHGWAIPAATDIAFAVGVLALLGPRIPASLKVFLLALAIIDDLGAILIIAVFYTSELSFIALALAAAGIAVLAALNRKGVGSVAAYALVGLFIWVCVLKSGVHATLSGVVTALAIPLAPKPGEKQGMLERLEESLHPWVTFGVLPAFAFANAGVSLAGMTLAKLGGAIPMGIALGLDAKRVQFTPDLMPSDILGTEVLEETPGGKRSFRFIAGPVFAQLLMADEINRASPRTQSALLQAMQEQHVTVAGARHDLPKPFHVLATQNPLEQEGTYPLPEAQLDRFLMEVDVDYPDLEAERKILFDTTGADETRAKAAMTADELIAAQRLVRRLPVGESVVEAILALVRSARPGPEAGDIGKLISWGPGPRASQALMLAVRARALLEGRFAPSVDDVLDLAEPVLKHRMALTFAARAEGETIPNVIGRLKARIG